MTGKFEKEVIDTVDVNGNPIKLAIKSPSAKVVRKAHAEYAAHFTKLVTGEQPVILRQALEDIMRKQGLWSDEKQKELEGLQEKLNKNQLKLTKGGIKLSEGRDIAIEMIRIRAKINRLNSRRNEMDALTAEGQADNHQFNYLISECVLDNETGKKYFKDLDDYLERANEKAAGAAATKLMSMLYDIDLDATKKLPEYKFLRKYGFVDEELRLINKDGHLIDVDGRLINEKGFYVDSEGNIVDKDGNRITEEGEYDVEQQPFTDDDGNIVE